MYLYKKSLFIIGERRILYYHILDMTLVAVLPSSEAGDGLEEHDSYFI